MLCLMTESTPPNVGNKSLLSVSVSDVLGLGQAASALLKAIEHGVGSLAAPWRRQRLALAEQQSALGWFEVLKKGELHPSSFDLALGERTTIRLFSVAMRHQSNRESIGYRAIKEFDDISGASRRDDAAMIEDE
jgi:hypothetical protein